MLLTKPQDKWVASHTRDELIKAHGSQTGQWEPVMLIDDKGIPHDFCTSIRNSNIVAEKVKSWVDGIIKSHNDTMSRFQSLHC